MSAVESVAQARAWSTAQSFAAVARRGGSTPEEMRESLLARNEEIRRRLADGVLGEMVARAGELEPLVHGTWQEARVLRLPPFHQPDRVRMMAAIADVQEQAGWRRAAAAIVVPKGRWGSSLRLEGHLALALADLHGPEEIVVVRTDKSDLGYVGRFPAGTRHVDFASATKGLADYERQRVLVEFLRSLQPQAAFNVNSRLLWHALRPHGRALTASVPLYGCLFCNDRTELGHEYGWPAAFFYRGFELLSGVVTDSRYLADSLRERFKVPPAMDGKLVTLHTPVVRPPRVPAAPEERPGRRRQVFWAGRFDRQKRLDVVCAIAAQLPEADFRVWGEAVLDEDYSNLTVPSNVRFEGVYEDFDALPLEECDAWLYTSAWDGVPNMLLEVAAAGIPLVASLVEGTGEVLVEGLCERVPDIEDVESFRAGLVRIFDDPAAARERASRLREHTLSDRTVDRFRSELQALLAGGGPS